MVGGPAALGNSKRPDSRPNPLSSMRIRMLMVQLQGKQSRVWASILGPRLLRIHMRPTRKGGGFEARPLFPGPVRRRRHEQSQLLGVARIDLLWWVKGVVDVPVRKMNDWPITRRAWPEGEQPRGRNTIGSGLSSQEVMPSLYGGAFNIFSTQAP
ncbi:hypothetical protein PMIN01_00395 [Paraphaeosphaeria minitans]|uniref:Uncharacterized protein n=1 Tax=Paraphaeosphaeria minitans TaxID=565426 RepID=A0A9P6GS47_9PLEO|nr:hypothetical protein PMIN01_00395 [Paraphaeosphaeria minitans]